MKYPNIELIKLTNNSAGLIVEQKRLFYNVRCVVIAETSFVYNIKKCGHMSYHY